MNCRQARALFSSRLDNELPPQDALSLQDHLVACAECTAKWDSFELTVRMIRSLPQVAPDGNFVGQVLDRVRGYEVERAAARAAREGWTDRARSALDAVFETVFDAGFWTRLVVPARLAGAVAFGVVAGFVVTERHVIPIPGSHAAAVRPGFVLSTGSNPGTAATAQPARPFGDLVDDIAASGRADSTALRSNQNRTLPGVVSDNPFGPGRQVNLSTSDGRPQITF